MRRNLLLAVCVCLVVVVQVHAGNRGRGRGGCGQTMGCAPMTGCEGSGYGSVGMGFGGCVPTGCMPMTCGGGPPSGTTNTTQVTTPSNQNSPDLYIEIPLPEEKPLPERKEPPRSIPITPPSPEMPSSFKLRLEVPAKAVVVINGRPTTQQGTTREYFAKNLNPNQKYRFLVQVDGEQKILLVSGGESRVENFNQPSVILTGK